MVESSLTWLTHRFNPLNFRQLTSWWILQFLTPSMKSVSFELNILIQVCKVFVLGGVGVDEETDEWHPGYMPTLYRWCVERTNGGKFASGQLQPAQIIWSVRRRKREDMLLCYPWCTWVAAVRFFHVFLWDMTHTSRLLTLTVTDFLATWGQQRRVMKHWRRSPFKFLAKSCSFSQPALRETLGWL